jgi:putative phosphoesterase
MQIAILSDTHLPRGGRRLPERCIDRLEAADLIIHAGDFSTLGVLRQLQRYAETVGVWGTVDEPALRVTLPVTTTIDVGRVRLGVIHDAGPAADRLARLRMEFPETAAVIFGHSHMPLHERAPDGFQIFNPGSPTERRRAPSHTMGIAHTDDGEERITFRLVEL